MKFKKEIFVQFEFKNIGHKDTNLTVGRQGYKGVQKKYLVNFGALVSWW